MEQLNEMENLFDFNHPFVSKPSFSQQVEFMEMSDSWKSLRVP